MQTFKSGNKLIHDVLFILIIWIVSLAIVMPNLGRPLSKHHEYNAAMVLMGVEAWMEKGGPGWSGYTPLLNYTHEGDLFINYRSTLLLDRKGNNIYASFGSSWYVMPFYFFQCLHLPPTPLSLQLFSVLLLLIALTFIFLLIKRCDNSDGKQFSSYYTTVLFLFNPAVLWYFSNGYFHEVAAWPFMLGAMYAYYRWQYSIDKHQLQWALLLAVCTFLSICSDWVMLVWIGVVVLFHLLQIFSGKVKKLPLFVLVASGALATCCVVMIYARHLGTEEYFTHLLQRVKFRSWGNAADESVWQMLLELIQNYLTALFPLVLLLVAQLFKYGVANMKNASIQRQSLIYSLALAVLLHQLLLLQFSSAHEYSVLKAVFPISFFCGTLLTQMRLRWAMLIIITTCTVGVLQYYVINRPGSVSYKGDSYAAAQQIGETIKAIAQPNEYVFGREYQMRPQIQYYAKRNLITAENVQEAKKILFQQTPGSKGIWFDIDRNGFVKSFQRFSIKR